MSNCENIIFFYEHHGDPTPANVLSALIPKIKPFSSGALCLEEYVEESRSFTYNNYQQGVKQLEDSYPTSFDSPAVYGILEMLMVGGERVTPERFQTFPTTVKEQILELAQEQSLSLKESIKTTLKLMDIAEEKGLGYCNFDMSDEEKRQLHAKDGVNAHTVKGHAERDAFMAENLLKECQKIDGSIIVLVGAEHFPVAEIVSKHTNILEYYTPSVPILENGIEIADMCIRKGGYVCQDHDFDRIKLFDFYKNPSLTPEEVATEIFTDLSNTFEHDEL